MANVGDILPPFSFLSDDDDDEPCPASLASLLPPFSLSSPPLDPDLFSTVYCPSFMYSDSDSASNASEIVPPPAEALCLDYLCFDDTGCDGGIIPPPAEPFCLDYLCFEDTGCDGGTENGDRGDRGWAEVNNRLDLLSMMVREGGADDLSSDGDLLVGGGVGGGAIAWDALLDLNTLQVEDDDLLVEDDDFMFGEFYGFAAPRTGLPTARLVVKTLPTVVVSRERVVDCGGEGCAVCKEEFVVEEEVKMLPCNHCYHGECILPWLEMKNTCPVCRYELPMDEAEDERIGVFRYEHEFSLEGLEYW